MRHLKNQKGFTLVELMEAVAISSVIAGGIFLTLHNGDEQVRFTDARITIQESAREALYKMTQELRLSTASLVTLGGGNTSVTFTIPNPASPVNTNTLDAIDDYTVNWGTGYQIQYALGGLDNRQIIRTQTTDTGGVTTKVIANDVTSMSFSTETDDNGSVNVVVVTVNVQHTLPNGRLVPAAPLAMTAKAELRNE